MIALLLVRWRLVVARQRPGPLPDGHEAV